MQQRKCKHGLKVKRACKIPYSHTVIQPYSPSFLDLQVPVWLRTVVALVKVVDADEAVLTA